MKIMMFCSNPVNGGTARIFYELSQTLPGLLKEDNDIVFCVNQGNPVEIYKKITGVIRLPVYSENEVCKGLYGGNLFTRIIKRICRKVIYQKTKRRNLFCMEEYIKENQIDCVLIHNGGYVGDDLCNQLLEAAYRRQVLCRVCVFHNDMEKDIFSKIRFIGYDRKVDREATRLVTVSNFTKRRIKKSSFIKSDIDVIYNGISESICLSSTDKKKSIRLIDGRIHVLMIGNFLANKGNLNFIKAAHMLITEKCNVDFTIIGNIYDSWYYDDCMDYIKKYDLREYIMIKQGIYNAAEYIDLFDILVVPSLYDESFGLICVEAMAKGVPVVAFSCGGIPEVVENGREGLLVPVGKNRDLANAIKYMLRCPEERMEMGENAKRKYLGRFASGIMAKEYMKLLLKECERCGTEIFKFRADQR